MIDLELFKQVFNTHIDIPNDSVKEDVANPYEVRDLSDRQKDVHLFLTNIRTFQQFATDEQREQYKFYVALARARKRGKPFVVRTTPPKFCRSYRIAFINFSKGQLHDIQFTSVSCKSWTCPACNATKAISVKYKLREIILLNNLNYFLTLTLDPSKIPLEYLSDIRNRTHKYITKLFNHFITVLKRKSFTYFDNKLGKWITFKHSEVNEKLKYVWVMEFQKNGNAHLHILLNQFLPIDVVRMIWIHVGGGHIMKVENVKSLNGISYYLTDYIVKGIKHDNTTHSGFKFFERRYSVSKSCIRNKLIFGNIDKSPELKQYMRDRKLDWITDYLYNTANPALTINFTSIPNE